MTIKIRTIELKDGRQRLRVRTPFHPAFPAKANLLGGNWKGADKEWSFDPRDEQRVRDLCKQIYGTDGTVTDLVSVRVTMDKMPVCDQLWLCGRMIAERRGRDEQVRLGDGVVVIAGGFPGSGGSHNNPSLSPRAGTVVEVRDAGREIAEKEQQRHGAEAIEIIAAGPVPMSETGIKAKLAELLARREELQKELDFIEEQIKVLTEVHTDA